MPQKKLDGDWFRLARYVVNRRVALGYRERPAFAEAVDLTTQTIGVLENGNRVAANTVAAVENALGWKPGSAQSILSGGEPILEEEPTAPAVERPVGADEVRRFMQILFDRYDDPATPEPERLMIRGTLAELARLAEQNSRAGGARGRTSA